MSNFVSLSEMTKFLQYLHLSYKVYSRTEVVNVNFRLGWQNNRGGFSLGCFLWVRGLYLPSAGQELHGVKHSLTLKIPLRSTTGASHPGLYSARR